MKTRVLTALVLIPVVLGVVFCTSPWPIGVLLLVVAGLATVEAAKLAGSTMAEVVASASFGIGLGIVSLLPMPAWRFIAWGGTSCYLTCFGAIGAYLVRSPRAGLLIGNWFAAPLGALFILHTIGFRDDAGPFAFKTPVLLALLPLWGGDTAAIFVGKAFGKHLMAPAISPKKTWEGGIANLIVCVAVAIPLAIWIGYAPWVGIACGLSAGILGQAGDLFESSLKRRANLKDSGSLLPGHGGILDRIDSLLFTAPAVALIVALAAH